MAGRGCMGNQIEDFQIFILQLPVQRHILYLFQENLEFSIITDSLKDEINVFGKMFEAGFWFHVVSL